MFKALCHSATEHISGSRAWAGVQVRGSGPWGLPLPWEARGLLDQVQAALGPHWPRLQQLAALPGAVEVGSVNAVGTLLLMLSQS